MSERMNKDIEVLLKLSDEIAVGRGCVVEEVPFIDGKVLVDDLDRGGTRRDHLPTAQTPFPSTPTPPKSFDFSRSLENSKNLLDYREYSKYCEYHINFRFCGVKVSKIQVEWKGGWWVIPSSAVCEFLEGGLSRLRGDLFKLVMFA
jgi:hypothetical protein